MKKWIFLIGLVAFLEASYNYYSYTMLGFPDGHLTELDQVYKIFHPIFSSLFLLTVILSIFVFFKKSFDLKMVLALLFLLILLNAALLGFDIYFSNTFDNGRGG